MVQENLLIETAPDTGGGVSLEQYAYVESKIIDFASRFMKRTAKERRNFLALAEELNSDSEDEVKNIAIEFIRDLCKAADKKESEYQDALLNLLLRVSSSL
ncbi:hypothetical protein L9W92_18445 [Pelotomaculum terephthalicicum JT]|uniref:hypothetical protein n=1 Tax=Pelotomaculum terephthalicicum TaxID=206393 RepID=UPI0009C71EAD|nr:hypothetical protein [Pelotomaculum terephthalicicum]MCG9969973.1 hypothetical protein [Pelotomaculum terephthalicicum JT]OPX90361.1 MAG: hypothetical protein A4E53_01044 [Pelotomaculum sp. PtaB.Bin104]OPY58160.1 MAG: hypothetical protein A4E56_03432 [Pelotomaculum sp. PtaU1.Bin065]